MKTITINDDVYNKLKLLKREKETFTDVIDRLIKSSLESKVELLLKFLEGFKISDKEINLLKGEVKKFEGDFRNFFPNRTRKEE